MINRDLVTPIDHAADYMSPHVHLPSPEELSERLAKRDIEVTIGEPLKGGTVSQVYEGKECGKPVVIKYTTDCYDADPTVLFLSHTEHYLDTHILKYLGSMGIRVPEVLHDFQDMPLTVMEDMRASGFTLLNDYVMTGKLPRDAAPAIGKGLGNLLKGMAQHPTFETVESAHQCYYERGFELRQAYPNDQAAFQRLEQRFTQDNQQLVAVDTHPKNIFVNADNEVAWIDFGRSVWGDRDFALPNCLAHIVVYAIAGNIPRQDAVSFVQEAVTAYREVLPIDDEVFTTYLAAEVIHRWAGKWIGGIETAEQKLALLRFGMTVFDKNIDNMQSLMTLLAQA